MKRYPQFLQAFVSLFVILLWAVPASAQNVTVLPSQIPNGVTAPSNFKQRIDIVMGADTGLTRSFTITMPPEVSIVSGSVTATSDNSSLRPFIASSSTSSMVFGLTGSTSGRTVTVEFDVRTPVTFSGIASGAALDTVYTIDFVSSFSNNSDQTPRVQLHQNKRLRIVQFTAPDSARGDTTSGGGRFYELGFNPIFSGSGLPDLEHTGISGLSQGLGFSDTQTDVTYSFYISTDSTLIRNTSQAEASMFVIGADDTPLAGQRQRPRVVPATFLREDFTSTFADSTEGIIALSGTAHNSVYYIYVASDESSDWFLGRSGPLLVNHPPEFVIAGWDYDDDGGDDYNTTGLIQVPSELISGGGQKDNNDVTVDSGDFISRGTAVPQEGFLTSPISSLNLLYKLEDVDNPGGVTMAIWLVPDSLSLTTSDLVPAGTLDSLRNSYKLSKSDTLTANSHIFSFQPFTRNATTNLITSFVPAGNFNVYFGAKDASSNVTLYKVRQDPFANPSTLAKLTVTHSPSINIDAAQFNDLGGDGDLDVETGIGTAQMASDIDGQNLSAEPSTRYVPISWGRAGIDGDLDVDDSATIDLYYTTRSNFKTVGGSNAYTSGNSDGSDILDDIAQGKTDTHLITSGLSMTADGVFDNLYNWDLWSYSSAEGTIPSTGTNYYIYAILKGNTTQRLVSMTSAGSIVFQHPPYIQPIEPAKALSVTVDEPIQVSWFAVDVDNTGQAGAVIPPKGQSAPNTRTAAPNIRILLTSADYGDVTTWASITNSSNTIPLWVGNSADGGLSREIELNEGVDTSFVMIGNRMRNNLKSSQELKIGVAHNVYMAIDGNGAGDLPTNFHGASPVVKAPGTITFSGSVPASPSTSARYIVPKEMQVFLKQDVQMPIIPEVSPHGTQVEVANIYITVDTTYFDPMDMDPNTAGVQPFSIGTRDSIDVSKITQSAYKDPTTQAKWRLDFRYDDANGTGLTFFDGAKPLAFVNLKARVKTGSTSITIDNSGTRTSNMLDGSLTTITPSISPDNETEVTLISRTVVTGTVPLQGRDAIHTSADTVTFALRSVGSYTTLDDSLFNTNDIDNAKQGVQIISTGVNGDFTLNHVPPGRWVLTAAVRRYLTGHDTLVVPAGQTSISSVLPVKLRDYTGSELLGGDAAGYTDSLGRSLPDNFIDSSDLNAINSSLFKTLGQTGYNTFADINQDSVVNGTDKDFATANQTSNTGEAGKKQPILPTFKQVVPDGDNSDATVSLADMPDGPLRPGETFDISVKVTGAVAVRTYEVHIEYEPDKVQPIDMVSNGSLFEFYLQDMAAKTRDNTDLGFVNSIIGRTPYGGSGDASLATVRFRVIGRGGETSFKLTDALLINVDHKEAVPKLDGHVQIALTNDPIVYHDADGNEIRGLILSDEDAKVDFNDFLILAQNFGSSAGQEGFDIRADLNGDETVNFADFLILTQDFNKVAVDAPAALRAGKVTPKAPGANASAHIGLKVDGQAKMGQDLVVDVTLNDAQAIAGWGATVGFDPLQYEFVEAIAPEGDMLSSAGGTPIFLVHHTTEGQVSLANALQGEGSASGDGVLARVILRPRGEFEDAQVEIFDGVLFDPSRLENPVSALLDIQPVPAEFALGQNYPNPFNPETTISYDLAAGGEVSLEIYNVMGQLVRTLVSDHQVAGRYRIRWSGDDAAGRQVASGVYFYRLQAADFHSVKKLMLLK